MPAMIVEFQNVSATMQGTVIKVESKGNPEQSGHYYFSSDYMEEFDGGSFDLEDGYSLPSEIGLIPEEERNTLRDEGKFPEEEEEVESESDE